MFIAGKIIDLTGFFQHAMFDDRRRLCTSSPPRIERIHATARSRALGLPQDLQTSPHFTDIGHTSVAGRFIPCIYIYTYTLIFIIVSTALSMIDSAPCRRKMFQSIIV